MASAPEKCPKCSAPLANDAKFCSECGEKILHLSTIVCPGCNNVISKSKFCPNCGRNIEHNFDLVSPKHNELYSLPQTSPVEAKNITPSEQFDQSCSLFPNKESDQSFVVIEKIKSNAANPTKKFTKPIIISATLIIAFFIGIIAIIPSIIKTSEHPESYTTSINCVHSYNLDGYCVFCGNYDQAFNIETECPHEYGNDGYCLLCQNYDESFKLDPYDYLSDFIIKNGNLNSEGNIYLYNFYTSDSWSVSIWYSPSEREFTLSCDYIFSGSESNTYLSFDRSNLTDFLAGMTQGDDALCAAESTFSKSSITTGFHVVFKEFEGQKDLKSPFNDMCDPMIVKSFKEFEIFIVSHGYALSDFGFTNFKH